jgi:ADP-ribose pyrophosphatase YjhB (NUDIX family)
LKFCSECGGAIALRWVEEDRCQRYVCGSCGETHYRNPRIVVGCVVCIGNQILLCRRAQEPARGQWALPTGYLELGETLQEGAARETCEETGVVINPELLELCLVVNMPKIEQVAIIFRADFENRPDARPGRECLDVAFMSEEQIAAESFAWSQSMGIGPREFFNELRSGDFSIHLADIGSSLGVGFRLRQYKIKAVLRS